MIWREPASARAASLSGTKCRRQQAAEGQETIDARDEPQHTRLLSHGRYFVGGDPQSTGFCDGPGPGMALEQNTCLLPTRPNGTY